MGNENRNILKNTHFFALKKNYDLLKVIIDDDTNILMAVK